MCETFQFGVAVHSSGELGIQLATMLHLGAVLPNLSFAADAHYHHLTDDIIVGGRGRRRFRRRPLTVRSRRPPSGAAEAGRAASFVSFPYLLDCPPWSSAPTSTRSAPSCRSA